MNSRSIALLAVVGAFVTGVIAGRQLPRPARELPPPLADLRNDGPTQTTPSQPASSASTAVQQFAVAVNNALREPSGRRRQNALARAGDAVRTADIAQALALLLQHREPETAELFENLLRRWARADPGSSLAYVRSLPVSPQRGTYLRCVLAEWATDAPTAAFDWTRSQKPDQERDQNFAAVLEAMAEQNPALALKLLNTLGRWPGRGAVLPAIMRHWAQRDIVAAIQTATGLSELNSDTLAELAGRWAASSPGEALAWGQALRMPEARDQAIEAVVRVWAGSNPRAAADYALARPAGSQQNGLIDTVARQWAVSDPAGALEWATHLPEGAIRSRAMQQVIDHYAEVDPKTAAAYVLNLPPGNDQNGIIGKIVGLWFKSDPAQALAWVRGLPAANLEAGVNPVFTELLGQSPKAASDFVLSLSEGRVQNPLLAQLALQWASTDLNGAIDWLKQLPDGQGKTRAMNGMAASWVKADPAGAASFALTLPPGEDSYSVINHLTREWSSIDLNAARAWMESLPAEEGRDVALRSLVGAWALQAPADAATYVASNLPSSPEQRDLATGVVSHWVNSDVKAAGEWVRQFPDGDMRSECMSLVANYLALSDPAAAASWLSSLGGQLSERAVERVVNGWMSADPTASAAWLDSLAQPNAKSKILLDTAWLLMDEKAARAWIQRTSLPEAAKQDLLRRR